MLPKKYKISFCIVCMNRLHQLKETLLQNIKDNEDYDNIEFIVLDYHSQDKMEEWIRENMMEYILDGKMTYYQTVEPTVFSHSHSKNIAFKLAGGDIVCNINADHYAGAGFARYINQAFMENNNIVLTTIDFHKTRKDYFPAKDVFGRVCVKKSDFLKIQGFDERMNRYGFEDWDFVNRLELIGVERVFIEDFSFLRFISHEEGERYSLNIDTLKDFYVHYCTPAIAELIFLFKDRHFEKGFLIDNSTVEAANYTYAFQRRNYRFEYTVKSPDWETGRWEESEADNVIYFISDRSDDFTLQKKYRDQYSVLQDERSAVLFYGISNQEIVRNVLGFNYFFYNRSLMEENLENKKQVVNQNGFGKTTVFKNFQLHSPLLV